MDGQITSSTKQYISSGRNGMNMLDPTEEAIVQAVMGPKAKKPSIAAYEEYGRLKDQTERSMPEFEPKALLEEDGSEKYIRGRGQPSVKKIAQKVTGLIAPVMSSIIKPLANKISGKGIMPPNARGRGAIMEKYLDMNKQKWSGMDTGLLTLKPYHMWRKLSKIILRELSEFLPEIMPNVSEDQIETLAAKMTTSAIGKHLIKYSAEHSTGRGKYSKQGLKYGAGSYALPIVTAALGKHMKELPKELLHRAKQAAKAIDAIKGRGKFVEKAKDIYHTIKKNAIKIYKEIEPYLKQIAPELSSGILDTIMKRYNLEDSDLAKSFKDKFEEGVTRWSKDEPVKEIAKDMGKRVASETISRVADKLEDEYGDQPIFQSAKKIGKQLFEEPADLSGAGEKKSRGKRKVKGAGFTLQLL